RHSSCLVLVYGTQQLRKTRSSGWEWSSIWPVLKPACSLATRSSAPGPIVWLVIAYPDDSLTTQFRQLAAAVTAV
ncbi:MAG: hypothetical protein AAF485_28460, partial [Chloroflexota bacterium]